MPTATPRALALALAQELVEKAGPQLAEPFLIEVSYPGIRLRVQLTPEDPDRLTPCEEDILEVVSSSDRPMPTTAILKALEARGMLHGTTTVKHYLARLVKAGRLRSGHRAPCGYRLPA